jgi:drug/metabolite transporter (DMT)-like permease
MNTRTKGFLLVFISAVGFGSMPVFARFAYQAGANMFELLTARFIVAGLMLSIYLWLRRVPGRLSTRERMGAILMGLCGYGAATLCFFSALQRISSPLASILLYTYPALVTVLTALIGTEKIDREKGVALLISFSGLVLILGSSFSSIDTIGAILALSAALLYSVYILMGSNFLRNASLPVATAWISWSAASGIGGYGLFNNYLIFNFGLNGWLAVAGLAVFSTAVAILAFLQGVMLVGASRASIISTLEPLITVVLAALFLSETLAPVQMAGGLLVLASAVLVNRKKREQTHGQGVERLATE